MKIKINFLRFLFIVLAINLNACSEDSFNENDQALASRMSSEHINTNENRAAIIELLNDENNYKRIFEENYIDLIANYEFSNYDESITMEENLINDYKNCSVCNEVEKNFLVPMFYQLLESENDEVEAILTQYEQQIRTLNLDYNQQQNLEFLFFTFKEGTKTYLTQSSQRGFWDCFGSNAGRNIGRGLVGGFLGGCAVGGYVGATAGTVTVPVIGTVVGGAAGCIAAGAVSGTIGAAFGAFWTAADCI
jgi:hypothetical protein